eukprot:6005707-Prymnesium_polylepis.1
MEGVERVSMQSARNASRARACTAGAHGEAASAVRARPDLRGVRACMRQTRRTLGEVPVDDPPHVGLVDAHAERDRRHDDARVAFGEVGPARARGAPARDADLSQHAEGAPAPEHTSAP